MKKYIAKLVFQIRIELYPGLAQFDEQWRWIEAPDAEAALAMATQMGNQHQEQFVNAEGKLVEWKFIGITALQCIDNKQHGDQIFSQTLETDSEDGFLNECRQTILLMQTRLPETV